VHQAPPAKPPIGPATRLCMSMSARPSPFGSRFHNHLYGQLGLDYVYKAFRVEDLSGAVTGIRALGVRGCAVSMPFKEAVIPLLDGLAPSASAIESVNTIVNDAGRLTGFNTDYGAVRALMERSGLERDTPFVLRGSGGMAKAVAAALRDAGFSRGEIVARNAEAGGRLASAYGFSWRPDLAHAAPILVNATPLGMAGSDAHTEVFPAGWVAGCEAVLDVVAAPLETPLLAAARAAGKRRITGAEIIVLQALEQFVLYTGASPSPTQVEAAAAFARGETER
jgi:shikimate dehydrogenase